MQKFNDLFLSGSSLSKVAFPSVSLSHGRHKLSLRFDSKDVLLEASYEGPADPWLSSLCFLTIGRSLHELESFNFETWKTVFADDQGFWDHFLEEEPLFFHPALELLRAALDLYRGRGHLYSDESPLICRCFGVRERDVVTHLHKTEVPTLETLSGETKAGMGCRSCVPQLRRWLVLKETKKSAHFYKNRPIAEWLLQIDYMLSCFPKCEDWKMEVRGMKDDQVFIGFRKNVSQREEEETGLELQRFLATSVDEDLSFFLSRED